MVIQQPSNQIKLTNVSLVRLKKGKKRFEIACYKNKVLEWRSGIETDLDNVLQIHNVFLNVSKGQTAPKDELAKAFGKDTSMDDIILEILRKGEMQVGEKERTAQLERIHNEVISIVTSKLVDPRTKRVYTPGMIEKALDMLSSMAHQNQQQDKEKNTTSNGTNTPSTSTEQPQPPTVEGNSKTQRLPTWTGVTANKSAKSQALDAIRALIAHQPIPVARARMRLRVTCPTSVLKQAVRASKGGSAAYKDGGDGGGDSKKGKKGRDKGTDKKEEAPATAQDGEEQKAPGTVKDKILGFIEQVESQDVVGSEWEIVGFVEPGAFKGLSDFIAGETKGQGRVEVLDMAVTHED